LFEPAGGRAGLDPADDLDELRDALLVQHRRDWLAYRGLLSAAAAEGGDGGVRRVKALGEAIRGMQAGEREAFGMDPVQLDFAGMPLWSGWRPSRPAVGRARRAERREPPRSQSRARPATAGRRSCCPTGGRPAGRSASP
jgi:hypothetical protein